MRPAAAFNPIASPRYHCPPRPRIGVVGSDTRPSPRASDVLDVLMSPALWLARQPPSSGRPRWSMRQVETVSPETLPTARDCVLLAPF